MDDQSKNYAKFLILSQMMFVCTYRKKLLIFSGNEGKHIFEEMAAHADVSLEALEVDQAHLHGLVKSEPRMRTASHRPQIEPRIDHATLQRHAQSVEKAILERENILE